MKTQIKVQDTALQTLAVLIAIIVLGVIFMYGSSFQYSQRIFNDASKVFNRHVVYVSVSTLMLLLVSRIHYRFFFQFSGMFFLITLISLILVLIPGIGIEKKGAQRWIPLLFFHFQPSEIAKITTLLYLAQLTAKKHLHFENFRKDCLPPLAILGTICLLILFQEDISSSTTLLIGGLSLLFVGGFPLRYFFYLAMSSFPGLMILFYSFPHIQSRLQSFFQKFIINGLLNYQEAQAQKIIASSGWFGSGLGSSGFNNILPESHTDFYYITIIADKGIIGGLITLGLLIYFYSLIFKLAYQNTVREQSLFIYGIGFTLAWQSLFNLSSELGLLPIVGIPLPFVSFGGNALLSYTLGISIIISISSIQSSSKAVR